MPSLALFGVLRPARNRSGGLFRGDLFWRVRTSLFLSSCLVVLAASLVLAPLISYQVFLYPGRIFSLRGREGGRGGVLHPSFCD